MDDKTRTDKMLSRKEGGVGYVIFNNPERHNAVSLEMWAATTDILESFRNDPEVRVVVVTGAGGKAFVSGADISKFESERSSMEAVKHYNVTVGKANQTVAEFPKPTIAMIKGYCIGGGLGLALCCDMRIASDNSKFGVPAAKLGLGYAYPGLKRLVDVVGPAFAKEIFYTGRQFDCAEAIAMGLINRAVPARRARGLRQELRRHDRGQRAADAQGGEVHRRRDRQGREPARPRPLQRAGRELLHQPGLHRRPPGLHGEAQTRFHGEVTIAPLVRTQFRGGAGNLRRQAVADAIYRFRSINPDGSGTIRPRHCGRIWRGVG